ncbi:transcription factor MYB1R1-like [Momordica charantia]|uniref:Transcription factor MYB1R1-like n=1 Tax=Momordica charantia TaxID=3673 RepID=A0A6J1DBK8_MOMCH|nr:transcription factor MYB1R1-like [Momordica charantia]
MHLRTTPLLITPTKNTFEYSFCRPEMKTEGDGGGIMLFGVRLREGTGSSFRKSVSMNNLSQYQHEHEQPQSHDSNNADAGYASDDVVHHSRGRKRGIPWTEEEHRLFLLGLQKVGKGDWRGISRNFVKTRTPTQVASHAQKYFLRRNNFNRRRRRSSLFDITTHTFTSSSMEDETMPPPLPPAPQPQKDSNALEMENPHANTTNSSKIIRPVPKLPVSPYPKFAELNINETTADEEPLPLTLKLSTPHPHPRSEGQSSGTGSSFQAAMSGGGDNIDIVSVA